MADNLLDKLADDAVSGMKGFFAHRINNGEDPTTCLRTFLNFLESNAEKNPQLFEKTVSKIDCSFFAPLKRVNQIASPDDFISTYHNLVGRLIQINPQIPYKADYERQAALIENANRSIKKRLLTEKEEKRRIVDDAYLEILSSRKKEYKESRRATAFRASFIVSFVLFVTMLLVYVLAGVPNLGDEESWHRSVLAFVIAGAIAGGVGASLPGALGGLAAGVLLWIYFVSYPSFSMVLSLVLGVILVIVYRSRVAAIQLPAVDRAACKTSLANIEEHFSDKEQHEIAQSTVEILTTDDH